MIKRVPYLFYNHRFKYNFYQFDTIFKKAIHVIIYDKDPGLIGFVCVKLLPVCYILDKVLNNFIFRN